MKKETIIYKLKLAEYAATIAPSVYQQLEQRRWAKIYKQKLKDHEQQSTRERKVNNLGSAS